MLTLELHAGRLRFVDRQDWLASLDYGLWAGAEDLLAGLPGWQAAEDGTRESFTRSDSRLRLELHASLLAPEAIALDFSVTWKGPGPLQINHIAAPLLNLNTERFAQPLWSLQGAAVSWGQDFAFPLLPGFSRENSLAHAQNGEGGGIPILDVWNKDHGLALMHIEPVPADWCMPASCTGQQVLLGLEYRAPVSLAPGEVFSGLRAVVTAHTGDFFTPISLYREQLARQGILAPEAVPSNYAPAWCSWGYGFDVRPEEVTGVLPAVEDLGLAWLTLDDRWFDAYGDWNPRSDTFPGGADDLRAMNDRLHSAGRLSQLWWYPLCVEDGEESWESHAYGHARVFREHPDWLILNLDGSVARNNRGLAMLCPAVAEVQQYHQALTRRFIEDWGFDGHKLDNIYTVPACHNPLHHHSRPQESTAAMASVYHDILEITRNLRPDSTTQICPCGTPLSFQLIPCTDQSVTADPTSSAQIRQRIKFYKALIGPGAAVFADHVELSDGGSDFASLIGPGGVPGTKFIWPDDPAISGRLQEKWPLTPARQAESRNWFELYNRHQMAAGEYLNVYDLAFDQPEGHLVRKGELLYFSFFTPQAVDRYLGSVELRGLRPAVDYHLTNLLTEESHGVVRGPTAAIQAAFTGALLLLAIPAGFADPSEKEKMR